MLAVGFFLGFIGIILFTILQRIFNFIIKGGVIKGGVVAIERFLITPIEKSCKKVF